MRATGVAYWAGEFGLPHSAVNRRRVIRDRFRRDGFFELIGGQLVGADTLIADKAFDADARVLEPLAAAGKMRCAI